MAMTGLTLIYKGGVRTTRNRILVDVECVRTGFLEGIEIESMCQS